MAARPKYRFITKPEGTDEWQELGAAWSLSNSENCSAKITSPSGETFKFLLVENKPRAANQNAASPAAKRNGPPDRRPAA